MLGIIVSQLFLLCIVKWWPVYVEYSVPDFDFTRETKIFTEQMIPTRQVTGPARPPLPQIPVPVPNDEVIEEEIEIQDIGHILSLEPIGDAILGQQGDGDEVVGSPQRRPRVVKIVEPIMPENARKDNIKAEVLITFLIDREGKIEEYFVSEIREYKSGGYTVVKSIGYGIIESAMEAAAQWTFKPALNDGKEVKAYTTQIFSFGF